MIQVHELRKQFDHFKALDGVNMHVGRGRFTDLWDRTAPENQHCYGI